MLLKGIAAVSVASAVALAYLLGGFHGYGFLWMIPVAAAGIGLVLLALAFFFLWAACQIIDQSKPQEKDSRFYRNLAYLYIEALIVLVGIRMEVSGLEKTPKEGRIMLVCNHQNESDPGVLLHYFRKSQLAFISKQENADMIVVGKIMHRMMCQLLNRENDREALKTILKCIQLIKDDEVSVAVFPEGGIKGDRELHPFRPGVFKIAQKTQVPIVVCTLQGTTDLFRNMKRLKPTPVKLHLVEVIEPAQYAGMSTVQLSEMVYDIMARDLTQYRHIGHDAGKDR